MKVAVAASACLLCFAVAASAAELVPPQSSPDAPQPQAQEPQIAPAKIDEDRRDRRKGDGDKASPTTDAVTSATKVKAETQLAHDDRRARQDLPRRDGSRPRVCLGPAETRENVAAHRLTEPFRALRAGRQQGEALRAKLCKWKQDQFVYEIFVLRRDGRVVRVYMNAQNGQAVGALDDR